MSDLKIRVESKIEVSACHLYDTRSFSLSDRDRKMAIDSGYLLLEEQ